MCSTKLLLCSTLLLCQNIQSNNRTENKGIVFPAISVDVKMFWIQCDFHKITVILNKSTV